MKSRFFNPIQAMRVKSFLEMAKRHHKEKKDAEKNDVEDLTVCELYRSYGISGLTPDVLGHGISLYRCEEYQQQQKAGSF
jgi:hypothetical protein